VAVAAVAIRPTEVVEAQAVVAAQRAAEVAARRPIPAGPFADSTFSPSYSSTQQRQQS